MKIITIAIITASILSANVKQDLQCQIKARDIGNSIDGIGIAIYDKAPISRRATKSIRLIDRYLTQCRVVNREKKRLTGIDNHLQMIRYRRDIVSALKKAKEVE